MNNTTKKEKNKRKIKMKCFIVDNTIVSEFFISRNGKLKEDIDSPLYKPFIFPEYWEKIALFNYFYMKFESGIQSDNNAQKIAALEFAKNAHDYIYNNEPVIIEINI